MEQNGGSLPGERAGQRWLNHRSSLKRRAAASQPSTGCQRCPGPTGAELDQSHRGVKSPPLIRTIRMLCGGQLRGCAHPKAHEVGRELGRCLSQACFCLVPFGAAGVAGIRRERLCSPQKGGAALGQQTDLCVCAATELIPCPHPPDQLLKLLCVLPAVRGCGAQLLAPAGAG